MGDLGWESTGGHAGLDGVEVHPLPAQEMILAAFDRLGFRLRHADVERGGIYGVRQELPFYQEIEYAAPPEYTREKQAKSDRSTPTALLNAMNAVMAPTVKVGECSRMAWSMTSGWNRWVSTSCDLDARATTA